MTIEITQQYQ